MNDYLEIAIVVVVATAVCEGIGHLPTWFGRAIDGGREGPTTPRRKRLSHVYTLVLTGGALFAHWCFVRSYVGTVVYLVQVFVIVGLFVAAELVARRRQSSRRG